MEPTNDAAGRGRVQVPAALTRLLPQTTKAWQAAAVVVVFAALAIYFDVGSGGAFVTSENLNLLTRQASVLAVVAAGTTAVMVMGEIDLSIGSAIYLTGLVAAWADVQWGLPLGVVVLATVVCGILLGAWQGFLVAVVGMPSFIVTLGGLLAFQGIGETWSQAASIAPVSGTFANFTEGTIAPTAGYVGVGVIGAASIVLICLRARRSADHGEPRVWVGAAVRIVTVMACVAVAIWMNRTAFGLPTAALWVLGVGGILWFLMARSRFGRDAYLIGSNRTAAFHAGISVRGRVFVGFLIAGISYGLGGLVLTARLDGSTATAGMNYELDAIAAAVLGGVSLRGGVGSVPGVLGGAFLLTLIQNGMDLTSTSTFLQAIVEAAILIGAVALDSIVRRRTLTSGA